MPHFSVPITPTGPLFDALIHISEAYRNALQVSGQPIPEPQRVRVLLDTGASTACLDPSIVTALNLQPTGNTEITTPSTGDTPHNVNLYDVSIIILPDLSPRLDEVAHPLIFNTIPAVECALFKMNGFHMIAGRDILESCTFFYNGPGNTIIVSY